MRLGQFLALLCIGLRLAVPAGFMVEREASLNPGWPLVLCTGEGAWAGSVHKQQHHHHDHGKGQDHERCPFAVLFAQNPIAMDQAALPVPSAFDFVADRSLIAQCRPGLAAPPPPSSGPPTLL